jgi:hypothetical protein
MFRLPFAKRPEEADAEELRDTDEMWALPDMEAAPPSPMAAVPEQRAAFQFEDQEIHPAGSFEAELSSWRLLPNDRVAWGFQVTSDSPRQRGAAPLELVTGATYRQDNHLARLLTALGAVAPREAAELDRAETRSELERTLSQLVPDSLIGRRCRIEVSHTRDELGNVAAQVSNVAPLGQG